MRCEGTHCGPNLAMTISSHELNLRVARFFHLQEESGIIPEGLIERGTLIYYSKNALIREGGDHAVKVWVYTCESWTGVPFE